MTRPIYDNEQLATAGVEMTPERAKAHCIISLVLRYGVPALFWILLYIGTYARLYGSMFNSMAIMLLMHLMVFAPYFASWGLMIGVRLHKKDCLFGKVLMVLYILDTAVVLLYGYISIATFINAMH
ncbi:MAG: hypothetical protein II046_01585 [Clostridiales bacterium]|jgi:hypothetical protein|nr:hypothetical protein [Clostridiales bacterium]MBQ1743618.1 hypothetical protein [Clostridiales bacterium]MBQ2155224.1 hypothetical protein [Clostridiales bacterium]MBQ5518735.1 hypothetical protein [Clostridiales bacterium]